MLYLPPFIRHWDPIFHHVQVRWLADADLQIARAPVSDVADIAQTLRNKPWLGALVLALGKAIRPVPPVIEPAIPEAQLVALTAIMSIATHFGFVQSLITKLEQGTCTTLANIEAAFPDYMSFPAPMNSDFAAVHAEVKQCLQTLQANPTPLQPEVLKKFISIAKEFTIVEQAIGS